MEVEMKIRGLMVDPVTNMPIVVLKDVNGNAILPIWVGVYEANAIALEIEKVATPRPMTHDLIRNLLFGLEAGVKKVVVSDLKDDTFFAVIWLERNGEMVIGGIRARATLWPSRCVWIVPYTSRRRSSRPPRPSPRLSEAGNNEELRRWLEDLNDEDLGRYKM